jgi:hypothetical protein
VRGRVNHLESAQGQSRLDFLASRQSLQLAPDWRNVSVERTLPLQGQTALIVSYAQGSCGSRMALLVVAAQKLWGPYRLGECNEMLAFQRSADGGSLVAVRAGVSDASAWTYSAAEQSFFGPALVNLPPSLAAMVAPVPALVVALEQPPAAASPEPAPSAPAPSAPARSEPTPAKPVKAAVVPKETPPRPRPAARPAVTAPVTAAASTTPPASFTPEEASQLAKQVRSSAPAQRRVSIDLT